MKFFRKIIKFSFLIFFLLGPLFKAFPLSSSPLHVDFIDAEFRHNKFAYPIENISGRVNIKNGRGETKSLFCKILNSTFHLKGNFMLHEKKWNFIVESISFNPDDFTKIIPKAKNLVPITPPIARIRLVRDNNIESREFFFYTKSFKIYAPKISEKFNNISGNELYVKATDSSEKLVINKLKFNIFDGYMLYRQETYKKKDKELIRAKLKKINLKKMFNFFPEYKNKIFGNLSINLIERDKIISGTFLVKNGLIQNLKFLKKIAHKVRTKNLNRIYFSHLSASFTKKDDFMDIRNFKFKSEVLDTEFNVKIVGKMQKLRGRGYIRIRLKALTGSRRLHNWGILKKIMRKNTLKLKLRISGTIDKPKIKLRF